MNTTNDRNKIAGPAMDDTELSPLSRGARPLEGLRVLDFSRVLSGPMGTMFLADLGAHVIKIEDLQGSDTTRHNPPYVGGESHYYLSLNRNKESISLDLKRPEGLEIALALAAQSDVVVENFRPGVADRLGVGYGALSKINPRLVYSAISGFGQTGPLRNKTAYDLVIQALTGAIAVTGEPDRPPVKMGLPLADELSAMFSAIGVLAALEKRERSGRGCYLDVSMFDTGVSLLSYMANVYFTTGESAKRLGSRHPTIYPYNAFQTADGYIVVAAFTQAFWRKFCAALGREDLPNDPRFTSFAERHSHRAELGAILEPIIRSLSTAEWERRLEAGDVPNGPVNSVAEAIELEQTHARRMVVEMDHPVAGRLRSLGTPFHFDFEGRSAFVPECRPAPLVGQHTRSILRELLGYDERHVDRLTAAKIVRQSDLASETAAKRRPAFAPSKPPLSQQPDDSLPLAGIRVLDLTRMFAGPYGAEILADLGAEVIKIEEPRIGDPTRRNIPFIKDQSTYFMSVNRGKKSVVLDLKTKDGRQAMLDLVAQSDVVIENYRVGVMDRLGLSYQELRERKPDIILCSISGYGKTGPLKDKISFDLVNQAMAGTMAVTGEEGMPPVRIGLPVGDLNGGIFSVLAILAALQSRRRTGAGAAIDLGLHDLLIALLGYVGQLYLITGESPRPVGSGHHHIAPYGAFEASDGYIVVAAFTQSFWAKFAKTIDRPYLVEDPRFITIDTRKVHMEALNDIIKPILRARSVDEWLVLLETGDVPCARVASIGEVLTSPQALAREIVFDFEHPTVGTVRTVGTPFRVDGKPWRTLVPPPTLGQHTSEVLSSLLGYSQERIDALAKEAG
jgi:crotonobetainyl-CoA:carnitine CoA-transferase CaiB-like acyl-CoA transferase